MFKPAGVIPIEDFLLVDILKHTGRMQGCMKARKFHIKFENKIEDEKREREREKNQLPLKFIDQIIIIINHIIFSIVNFTSCCNTLFHASFNKCCIASSVLSSASGYRPI